MSGGRVGSVASPVCGRSRRFQEILTQPAQPAFGSPAGNFIFSVLVVFAGVEVEHA